MKVQHGMIGKKNALKGDVALDSRIFSRCKSSDKGAWVAAAIENKLKLTEWIIKTLNEAVKKD